MPSKMSIERRILLRAFGAEVYLVDSRKGLKGCMDKVEEIISHTPNGYVLQQFENLTNPKVLFSQKICDIWKRLSELNDYMIILLDPL